MRIAQKTELELPNYAKESKVNKTADVELLILLS